MNGTVTTGDGVAAGFVETAADRLVASIGFDPYPGTLNLRGASIDDALPRRVIGGEWGDHCESVTFWPCRVRGVRAAIVQPDVADYPPERTELLAPISLRRLFRLEDGDRLGIDDPDTVWPPSSVPVPCRLDGFDGVIVALDEASLRVSVGCSVAPVLSDSNQLSLASVLGFIPSRT